MKLSTEQSLVPPEFIAEHLERARSFLTHATRLDKHYSAPEESISLPFDRELHTGIKNLWEAKRGDGLKYVVVVGIGGSNLGAKAIFDALAPAGPNLLCVDTCDSTTLLDAQKKLQTIKNPHEVLIFIISKSGTTTETAWNADFVKESFPNGLVGNDRWVVITDEGSALWNMAGEQKISRLQIPKVVGGRYSVFSAVGLAPLRFLLGDETELLLGAQEMAELCAQDNYTKNPALQSALMLYYHIQNGKTVHDTFFFEPRLESVGKWYRQLLAESIGKTKANGTPTGIIPTVSLGSVDLHSIGQLYLGGVATTYTTFLSVANQESMSLKESFWSKIVPKISKKTNVEVMDAILSGTKTAYVNRNNPFTHAELDSLSARSLGEFIQWKMCEVMLLGKLLEVNPFDQPAVELYKKETRAILEQ